MGLNLTRKIFTAFLPADYREHVLGDLEERGFRIRDAVSVLPHVWISYYRRTRIPWLSILYGFLAGSSLAEVMKMPYSIGSIFVLFFVIDAWRRRLNFQWKQLSTKMLFVLAATSSAAYFTVGWRAIVFAVAMILTFGLQPLRTNPRRRK